MLTDKQVILWRIPEITKQHKSKTENIQYGFCDWFFSPINLFELWRHQ